MIYSLEMVDNDSKKELDLTHKIRLETAGSIIPSKTLNIEKIFKSKKCIKKIYHANLAVSVPQLQTVLRLSILVSEEY